MDTLNSMPLSRTAFCHIDDGMEQFGSYNIFYKSEKRRDEHTHILFFKDNVYELKYVYIFQLRQDRDDILVTYRETEYGSPKTMTIIHEQSARYGPKVPQDVELIELYEWLHVRLFSLSLMPQTSPSVSCIQPSQDACPSLLLQTSSETQSDPTCSSSDPSLSDPQMYGQQSHA